MKDEKGKPQDLRLRTKAFALRVIKLYAALPKATVAQVLGKQVLRSGTAVGANYREAYRARSTAEFTAKLGGLPEGIGRNDVLAGIVGRGWRGDPRTPGPAPGRGKSVDRNFHDDREEEKGGRMNCGG